MSYTKFLRAILADKINKENYLLLVTLGFYFLSLFNLNNKTVMVSFLVLIVFLLYKKNNLINSLITASIVSLIFVIGKSWTYQLIPPEKIANTDYKSGYQLVITITAFNILTGLLAIVIIRDFLANKLQVQRFLKLYRDPKIIFLTLFFAWPLLVGIINFESSNIPLFLSLINFSALILLISLRLYNFSFNSTVSIMAGMTIFEALLSLIQYVKRSALGSVIESGSGPLSFQKGIDQNFLSVRSIGTFSHPNELGVFGLIMVFVFLAYAYLKQKYIFARKTYLIFFSSALICIILSLGRAVWLSFIIGLLILLYFFEKKYNLYFLTLDNLKKIQRKQAVYILLFFILAALITIPRIGKAIYLFKDESGGDARIEQIREGLQLLRQNLIFGVGSGLGGLAMFTSNPQGIVSRFPAPIHNLYLLMAVENGLPALIFFICFVIVLLKDALAPNDKSSKDDKIKKIGAAAGLIALLINWFSSQIFPAELFVLLSYLIW